MTIDKFYSAFCTQFAELSEADSVFYDHIEVQEGQEVEPPYIVIKETPADPFFADNQTYYLTINDNLIAYTTSDFENLIDAIDEFLTNAEIPFSRESEWNEDTWLYEHTYSLALNAEEDQDDEQDNDQT